MCVACRRWDGEGKVLRCWGWAENIKVIVIFNRDGVGGAEDTLKEELSKIE